MKQKKTKIDMLRAGKAPGFFLGGGAPLRNVVIDFEVKRNLKRVRLTRSVTFSIPEPSLSKQSARSVMHQREALWGREWVCQKGPEQENYYM